METDETSGGRGERRRVEQRLRVALVAVGMNAQRALQVLAQERIWSLDIFEKPALIWRMRQVAYPQVVLIEMDSEASADVRRLHLLKEVVPKVPILMLTSTPDAGRILLSILAGACGCLLCPFDDEAAQAVENAAKGKPFLGDEAFEMVIEHLRNAGAQLLRKDGLTKREAETLACILNGESDADKAIGNALGIASATAHQHVVHLCRKLGMHGRKELLLKILGLGAARK
jgi:DNA-binding NarL/FixJ family response regulator